MKAPARRQKLLLVFRFFLFSLGAAPIGACSSPAAVKPPVDANATEPTWCGRGADVFGAVAADGFCLKEYAQIGEARFMVVAPNGDLFVAAPSNPTPGGANGGPGAIMLLSDDNHDGVAEAYPFLTGVSDVHGMALGDGYLYYTTQNTVFRTPYVNGQRKAVGAPEDLKLPASFSTGGRWTHGLARSVGGQLFASRGEYASCSAMPKSGDISTIGQGGSLTTIASGFRNPMYMRCHRTDEVCAAMELGEDLLSNAHEKMLMLHPGGTASYGFPCCTTTATIASNVSDPTLMAMCGAVTKEDATFPLSNTPFGFDWEPGVWPAPFQNAVFVALHGSAYSIKPWEGAAVVYAPTDPTTHAPVAGAGWKVFQGGFTSDGSVLDRPSDIAFSSDGRMFIADDQSGHIYWMAPTTLAAPTPATN